MRALRERLAAGKGNFELVFPRLEQLLIRLIAAIPENGSVLLRILADLHRRVRYYDPRVPTRRGRDQCLWWKR